jgi:hypothetical protein
MFAPSFGQNVMAIVGLPVALWLTALGTGLAIERVTRARLHNALLLPLGVAGGIVLSYAIYSLGSSDVAPVVVLVVVSGLGLVFARGGLRSRINPGLPGLAALCVFVLFMLPVLVSGHWLWVGYNFDNDTSVQFLLTQHLKQMGTDMVSPQLTTASAVIDTYLGTSYPLGAHAELATLSGLLHTGPAVLYQAYLSALAALVAMAVAVAAAPAIGSRRAAVVGFAAAAANLFFQYAMQGNVKEIAMASMTITAFALIAEGLRARRVQSGIALASIALAAMLCTYGAAGSPYVVAAIGATALTLVVFERRLPRLSWVAPGALGAALVALLSLPALVGFSQLFSAVQTTVGVSSTPATGGGSTLGQLVRALPLSQISGVWLNGDYRIPVSGHAGDLTALASAVILLLLIPGVLFSLRRRDAGPLIATITTGLVLLIIIPRVTPYAAGKVYAMASPVVVWVAGVGLCSLRRRWLALAAGAAGVALTLAIVISDLLAYHVDQPSPTSRMLAIQATAEHFASSGPVLFNESDEFIKFFAGSTYTIAPFDSITPMRALLINPSVSLFDYFFDLDEETLQYVESFPVIVTRRSPIVSRPPSNYRLVYSNSLYLGWKRQSRPVVLAHLPLQSEWSGTATPACTSLASLIHDAPRGSELIEAVTPPQTGFSVLDAPKLPLTWTINQDPYNSVTPIGPGKVLETVRVPVSGLYRAWVQGSFPRPMRVLVDGRAVGQVDGVDSVDQWSAAGLVHLSAGDHLLELYRGGGRIYPGDGWFDSEVGYVMLAKAGPEVLRTLPVSHWRSLCSSPADWIELVRH